MIPAEATNIKINIVMPHTSFSVSYLNIFITAKHSNKENKGGNNNVVHLVLLFYL